MIAMHDVVIRGGTIIDGTGAAPFTGDVAIEGQLGPRAARSTRRDCW
jgi:N-acyl-D-aspartate/D-glutamate deacylase